MADILHFPDPRGEPWSDDERREFMVDLHRRLMESLQGQDEMQVTLSIDDVCELCQLIEEAIGPGHLDDQIN